MKEDFGINKKFQRIFIEDRKGHDYRYAINSDSTASELQWHPKIDFESGLKSTINWYINNPSWFDKIK